MSQQDLRFFSVGYKLGRENPAGFMSRHSTKFSVKENMTDEYVRYITANATSKIMTIEGVQREQKKMRYFKQL